VPLSDCYNVKMSNLCKTDVSVAPLMNMLKACLRHRVAGDCFGATVVTVICSDVLSKGMESFM